MATTVSKLWEGLNEANRLLFRADEDGTISDTSSWTITVPSEYIDKGALPVVEAVGAYGAGDVGARTFTYAAMADGSGGTGVTVDSYNEDTGVLTLTNETGGNLVTPVVFFTMIGDVE